MIHDTFIDYLISWLHNKGCARIQYTSYYSQLLMRKLGISDVNKCLKTITAQYKYGLFRVNNIGTMVPILDGNANHVAHT